jgi:diguanylate cyclase (GGDEF)-like protein
LNILLIDNNKTCLLTASAELSKLGHTLITTTDPKRAFALYEESTPDLIILNIMIGEINSYDIAKQIRADNEAHDDWIPIIYLSDAFTDEMLLAGIAAGGDDYLTKPLNPVILQTKITAMARIARMRKKLLDMNNTLMTLSLTDRLTGIPNRFSFENTLTSCIKHAKRHDETFAVLFINLDHFKTINDTLGHATGDLLLQAASNRMTAVLHTEDYLARIAGDEFVAILTSLSDPHNAGIIAEKIVHSFALPFNIDQHEISISSSVGIACYPTAGTDEDTLTTHADMAMHHAKESGRNTYHYFSKKLNDEHMLRIEIEKSLVTAIKKNEFFLMFQPKYQLADQKIIGFEALIRWEHPTFGPTPPDDFIPITEETGLIVPLGKWILNEALSQFKKWHNSNPTLHIAINISPVQLLSKGFDHDVLSAIEKNNLPYDAVQLEITETAIMAHSDESQQVLTKLHSKGITIDIDDFGTGYSSLSHIKRLPIDNLKIDKEFVMDIFEDANDAAIVKSIIAMSKNLGIGLIAEGIETKEQLEFLISHGCPHGQGYYFSKPLPADNVEAFINKNQEKT